jgi:GcrA cell cycle regulator
MTWTDERVDLLKKLWAEGHSAAQVAKQLGGVSRNAVIGKVHRLGLPQRASPSRPAKRPQRPGRQRPMNGALQARPRLASAEPSVPMPDLAPMTFEDGAPANVLTLKETMCKFPIGDPAEPGFAFCGRGACSGPYCADHARVVYQPAPARKRREAQSPNELQRMLRLAAL